MRTIVDTYPDGSQVIRWQDGSITIQPPLIPWLEGDDADVRIRGGVVVDPTDRDDRSVEQGPLGHRNVPRTDKETALTAGSDRVRGDLVVYPLMSLCKAVEGLSRLVATMPGASRPSLDYIAADLMDAQIALGMQPNNAPNPRPRSAWPEGEEKEPRS